MFQKSIKLIFGGLLKWEHKEAVLPLTRVLPIVGLDVGAIGSISFVSFSLGLTMAILLFVFTFIKSFSIELQLPGGGFSNYSTIGNTGSLCVI